MIRRLFTGLSMLVTLAAVVPPRADAQPSDAAPNEAVPPRCHAVDYSEPTRGGAPITVDQLEGQAVFAPVGSRYELGGANGVCLALFREGEEKPAVLGATDEGGRFALPRPEPGTYIFVAALEPIHDITAALRVSDAPTWPDAERGLLLHVRATEDERRSFASVLRHLGLRRELLEMRRLDQEVRNEWIRGGVAAPSPETLSRMAEIDARNIGRLQAIVEQHGWPGADLVGLDGAESAFLVLQHASHAVQKELFPIVEAGYGAGDGVGAELRAAARSDPRRGRPAAGVRQPGPAVRRVARRWTGPRADRGRSERRRPQSRGRVAAPRGVPGAVEEHLPVGEVSDNRKQHRGQEACR